MSEWMSEWRWRKCNLLDKCYQTGAQNRQMPVYLSFSASLFCFRCLKQMAGGGSRLVASSHKGHVTVNWDMIVTHKLACTAICDVFSDSEEIREGIRNWTGILYYRFRGKGYVLMDIVYHCMSGREKCIGSSIRDQSIFQHSGKSLTDHAFSF